MANPTDILDYLPQGKKILALCGPKGSGKDTAAARLLTRNQIEGREYFKRLPFMGPFKDAASIIFGLTTDEMEDGHLKDVPLDRWPYQTPRQLIIDSAEYFRAKYDQEVHTRSWLRTVTKVHTQCILVTDLRFPDELERLQKMGAYVVYVQRDSSEAALQAEREMLGEAASRTESYYALLKRSADFTLTNNSGYESLFAQVEGLVTSLWGNWLTWSAIPLYQRPA